MRNKTRDTYYDDEDENTVRDGDHVHVPLHLCDSLQSRNAPVVRAAVVDAQNHRPHFATLTDAENLRRRLAREQMIAASENAWRTAGRDAAKPEPDGVDDPDDDTNDREQARRRYLDNLTNAWRPQRMVTGFGPNTAAGPDRTTIGVGPARNSRDAQAIRDAAYAQYCDRLYSAWRGGR